MSPSAVNPSRIRWSQLGGSQDFSGGPNVRDAPSELAPNEAEDAYNVTFDERGGVSSRLGYVKTNGTPFSGGVVKNVFWSQLLGARVTQAGAVIYLADTNTARHTFSTSALVTFSELADKLVAVHPVDGIFTSTDGITWTVVADADAPTTGLLCVCTWQNKLFVGASDGTLYWSALGDPTSWVTTDFNKIWEKDRQPIVALHIGSGQDILGQAGLLVFKQESFYRVDDSTTGSYTTVDATIGAAGPLSVTGVGAKVIWIGKHGVYWWADGVVGAQNGTADRFQPLWNSGQLNLTQQTLWCAGRKGTRSVFSLTRAGSTANDLSFEYHPDQGWLAPGSNAMSAYASATGSSDMVYGGSPSVTGQVYTLDQGGTDDGAAISWRFQTRWFDLAGGLLATVWQVRAQMRGAGVFTVLKNYEASGMGKDYPFDLGNTVGTYDSGDFYDSGGLYGISVFQATAKFFSIGTLKQMSFRFTGSSSDTATGVPLLGGAVGPTVGSFGLFGLAYAWWWLGFDS